MTDVVIQAENLGKQYTTGHQTENGRYVALRDVLAQNARKLCAAPSGAPPPTCCAVSPSSRTITLEEVWALKDIKLRDRVHFNSGAKAR